MPASIRASKRRHHEAASLKVCGERSDSPPHVVASPAMSDRVPFTPRRAARVTSRRYPGAVAVAGVRNLDNGPPSRSPSTAPNPFAKSALALLLPLGLVVTLPGSARLYGADVLALALAPFLLTPTALHRRPRLRTLLLAGLAWIVMQIISDAWHAVAVHDQVNNQARTATLLLFVALLAQVFASSRLIVLFFCSFASGQLVTFFVHPTPFSVGEPWKFGLASPTTYAAVLLCGLLVARRRTTVGFALLAGLALVHAAANYRGQALVVAGTLLAVVVARFTPLERGGWWRLTIFALAFAAVAAIGASVYAREASSGALGTRAQLKYVMETRYSTNPIISGRSEIVASTQAIRDSPLLGFGSDARSGKYAGLLPIEKRVDERGIPSDRIPTHSHLFASWVDAGVVGAVFWFLVLALLVKAFVISISTLGALTPLFLYNDLNLLWDVLFSPLGADRRLSTAAGIALVLCQLQYSVRHHPEHGRPRPVG